MKVFKETQRFTQPWLIVLMTVSLVVPIAVLGQAFQKGEMSLQAFLITLFVIALSGGIIFIFKLTTRIDEKGIHYQFFPFHLKMRLINWSEIKKAHVRTYDPIGEYGGWGLKGGYFWRKEKGIAINVKGDVGIQLELKDDKKILIGTQKTEEAKQVLRKYINKVDE